jgi:hypothetical protein
LHAIAAAVWAFHFGGLYGKSIHALQVAMLYRTQRGNAQRPLAAVPIIPSPCNYSNKIVRSLYFYEVIRPET